MEITVVIIGLLVAIGLIGTGIYLAFRLVRFCLRLITVWERNNGFH